MNYDYAGKIALKSKLQNFCIETLTSRLHTAEGLVSAAQESANGEGKSSAGDKYETARAMGHLQKDMYQSQVQNLKSDLAKINTTDVTILNNQVKRGSVIILDELIIYVCAGLGKKEIDDNIVFFISDAAPLYKNISGKSAGDHILIEEKSYLIKALF